MIAVGYLGTLPMAVFAQNSNPNAQGLPNRSIVMSTGIRIPFAQALENLVTFLAASIVSITIVVFLIGATYVVGSRGKPDLADKGKKLMTNSLIGMAVVLGSYTIARTVLYLIYI